MVAYVSSSGHCSSIAALNPHVAAGVVHRPAGEQRRFRRKPLTKMSLATEVREVVL
jgi:hypothetical protein